MKSCRAYMNRDRTELCGSTVFTPAGQWHTLMGWFDPTETEGHYHDINRYTEAFVCERGHQSEGNVVLGPPCPKEAEGCAWRPPTHWLPKKQPTFKDIKIGDVVTRMLGGVVEMQLKVTDVDDTFIYCGPKDIGWKFSRETGYEVDDMLSGVASYLVLDNNK